MPSSSLTITRQFFSSCNPALTQTYINDSKTASDNHNLNQVIDLSTKALSHVIQSEVVTLLNLRAHALGMKGYFDKAIQDAGRIIRFVPDRSIGYLRLGDLLHMQGKQIRAIIVYQEALVKVSKQDPGYQQLVQDKRKAEEKSKRRVDMIPLLPFELVDTIFDYLPEKTKVIACLDVSKKWRGKISCSQMLWTTVLDNFEEDGDGLSALVSRAVPHIAHHIKNLTLDTNDTEIAQIYLEYLGKGYFKKLKYFTWFST